MTRISKLDAQMIQGMLPFYFNELPTLFQERKDD